MSDGEIRIPFRSRGDSLADVAIEVRAFDPEGAPHLPRARPPGGAADVLVATLTNAEPTTVDEMTVPELRAQFKELTKDIDTRPAPRIVSFEC